MNFVSDLLNTKLVECVDNVSNFIVDLFTD